ncbi:hypothetical protein NEOLEDRAFT_313387 [Neolentinus lepideus HHB14362 ss-1]|uniref:Uncharacterized protein n=1 Tax=Neolentinus lepideus HHB14362 ss-1 TaxID=1314782 RepID=A0A165VTA7_9AGAM|nr:hypothetical protein NEOLEDRAFT_313387 [Neolentinus lepideus HHB14362 ss-1]
MTTASVFTNNRPVKRLPNKRRKLTAPSSVYNEEPMTLEKDAGYTLSKPTKPLACEACHRSLNVRGCPVIICARCNATTCTICSRICNACPAASLPPTPALTFSPSPPATPDRSPRRIGLSLSSMNMNVNGSPNATSTGKRRKYRDSEDEEQEHDEEGEKYDKWSMSGCGRTVCRYCCLEDALSNTTTCCDCYGRA